MNGNKSMSQSIRCSIIRGGTSKGVYLRDIDLPREPIMREKTILKIFGSPDKRQIDGLGGADTLTSKVCIIGPAPKNKKMHIMQILATHIWTSQNRSTHSRF